jgi:hypothetical protein
MVKKIVMVLLVSLVLGGSLGFFYQRKQTQPRAQVESVTLESLLQEAARASQKQQEFSLFVPDRLTYHGQSVAQDLAISVLSDAMLAKEIMPVDAAEIGNGRLIQYKVMNADLLKQMQAK